MVLRSILNRLIVRFSLELWLLQIRWWQSLEVEGLVGQELAPLDPNPVQWAVRTYHVIQSCDPSEQCWEDPMNCNLSWVPPSVGCLVCSWCVCCSGEVLMWKKKEGRIPVTDNKHWAANPSVSFASVVLLTAVQIARLVFLLMGDFAVFSADTTINSLVWRKEHWCQKQDQCDEVHRNANVLEAVPIRSSPNVSWCHPEREKRRWTILLSPFLHEFFLFVSVFVTK